jgi:hypothetical protein
VRVRRSPVDHRAGVASQRARFSLRDVDVPVTNTERARDSAHLRGGADSNASDDVRVQRMTRYATLHASGAIASRAIRARSPQKECAAPGEASKRIARWMLALDHECSPTDRRRGAWSD